MAWSLCSLDLLCPLVKPKSFWVFTSGLDFSKVSLLVGYLEPVGPPAEQLRLFF